MAQFNFDTDLYHSTVATGNFDVHPNHHTNTLNQTVSPTHNANANSTTFAAGSLDAYPVLHPYLVGVSESLNDYLSSRQAAVDEAAIIQQLGSLPFDAKADAPTIVLPPLLSDSVTPVTRDWEFPEARTDTFYSNVHKTSGLTRTKAGKARRFQPYGAHAAQPAEHTNAEAGPSTLPPPPASQPSGRHSEAKPDAITKQTSTEEVETLEQTRVPQEAREDRYYRAGYQTCTSRLTEWIQRRRNSKYPITINYALAAAIEVVEKTKDLVYDEPCLLVGKSEETDAVTPRIYCGGRAEEGRGRWQKTRSLLQVLSRYFQRPTRKDWTRPTLLSEVVRYLEQLPDPPTDPGSAPGTSEPTA